MKYNDDLMDDLEIRKKLKTLDILCKEDDIKASFILVGGAALVLTLALHNKQIRTTRDIDVSETTVNNNDSDKLLNHFNLLNISTNVDALIHPPGVEILEEGEYKEFNDDYTNIRVYLVTPEMLVVTKAFSKRKRDLEDILNEDLLDLIDPKKTISLIEEFKTYYIFADDPELNVSDILPKLKKMVYNKDNNSNLWFGGEQYGRS